MLKIIRGKITESNMMLLKKNPSLKKNLKINPIIVSKEIVYFYSRFNKNIRISVIYEYSMTEWKNTTVRVNDSLSTGENTLYLFLDGV